MPRNIIARNIDPLEERTEEIFSENRNLTQTVSPNKYKIRDSTTETEVRKDCSLQSQNKYVNSTHKSR